eukprot:TRINITY_DN5540_c0_g1_i1.p1 TRINITY_DN5540_c0_g1~~TRINITY_DN5540_c0_g1_i1.p1  ORF type:complete len:663 (+),score=181.03 TRINITY_DN5540_c0_g1_i1:100-2088(+)
MESVREEEKDEDKPPSYNLEEENARLSSELSTLQSELEKARIELGEAQSQLTVVEVVKEENALALEREKEALNLESVTLKTLLAETEDENARIRAELETKGSALPGLTSSTISDVTKSLARRMKTNLQTVVKESGAGLPNGQDENELLKSVIGPLEEQIQALKSKLRHTDTLLRETELRHAKTLLAIPSLASWLDGKPLEEVSEALQTNSTSASMITNTTPEATSPETESFDALMRVRYGLLLTERNELRSLYEKEITTSSKFRKELMEANSTILRVTTGKSEDQRATESSEPKMVPVSEWNRVLGAVKSNEVSVEDIRSQLDESRKQNEKYKEDLQRESIFRKEIEAKWNDSAERHRSETEALAINVRNTEKLLENLRTSYSIVQETNRSNLRSLTADRVKIVREFKRLQEENDCLVGKHSLRSQEFENQVIQLPDKIEDIHTLLLKYREDLISAKIAKEMLEEKMKGEVNFLKAQLTSEAQAKESIEESLSCEIDDLRGKNQSLEHVRKDLEEERVFRSQAQEKLRAYENLKLSHAKLVKDNAELKSRISNLQSELDNSVAVQTDFVRLSQSLQIELEKIRQSDKEVRWQHDEDVSSCPTCSCSFGPTKRRHHCKHCGKVFCSDCLAKSVHSGPSGRPSRVCNVCYTLLVSDSAPYFSVD